MEVVSEHIERTVGPIAMVFHELLSDDLHIDVHHVAPASDRPYHALITSGMSEMPMHVPPGAESFRYAELSLLLDPSWDLRYDTFDDENRYWPIRLLKLLARYPFEHDTWLGYGHSIAGFDPPRPFAPGTELSASILLSPFTLGHAFSTLVRPDGITVRFWNVVPLYRDELDLKRRADTDTLLEAFDRAGITDVVAQSRPHARAKPRWFGRSRGAS